MGQHIDELLARFGTDTPDFANVIELLQEIRRLDQDRVKHLGMLRTKTRDLTKALSEGVLEVDAGNALRDWADQYRGGLERTASQLRITFGPELEQELKVLGHPLSGHYPLLQSGLFVLETDFSRYRLYIWYGPKQESLGQCSLSSSEAAEMINGLYTDLGGGIGENSFRAVLRDVYEERTTRHKTGEIPIVPLAFAVAMKHYGRGRRKRAKRFDRADLSYNLYRYSDSLMQDGWRLKVATLSMTRRRSSFLWIPDNERGKGTYYSHIKLGSRHD